MESVELRRNKEDALSDLSPEAEFKLYCGNNAEYYLSKWSVPHHSGWNWAAFLFTYHWLAYRKMYGIVTLLFLTMTVLNILYLLVLPEETIGAVVFLTELTIHIFLGARGNALYRHFVRNNLQRLRDQFADPKDRYHAIASKGGTSVAGVIVTILLSVVYIAVMIAFSVGVILYKTASTGLM